MDSAIISISRSRMLFLRAAPRQSAIVAWMAAILWRAFCRTQAAFLGQGQQRLGSVWQHIGAHDRRRSRPPRVRIGVHIEERAEHPGASVCEEPVVAKVVVGVAEDDGGDDAVEQFSVIGFGRK